MDGVGIAGEGGNAQKQEFWPVARDRVLFLSWASWVG